MFWLGHNTPLATDHAHEFYTLAVLVQFGLAHAGLVWGGISTLMLVAGFVARVLAPWDGSTPDHWHWGTVLTSVSFGVPLSILVELLAARHEMHRWQMYRAARAQFRKGLNTTALLERMLPAKVLDTMLADEFPESEPQ
jgi:uncharacterized membrane protein YeiB